MKRNRVVDIIRALAIILVVVGHFIKPGLIKDIIYSFHLPVFFIITGYLYKEKKENERETYFTHKLFTYIKYYVLYNTILVLLHNILLRANVIESSLYYLAQFSYALLNSFLLISAEPFSAAMWFLPVSLFSLILFHYLKSSIKDSKKQYIIMALMTLIGIYFNYKNLNIGLHYQTSLVVLPFLYLGNWLKKNERKIHPNLLIGVFCLAMVVLSPSIFNHEVELSINQLGNIILFYLIPMIAFYLLYTISYYIDKYLNRLSRVLAKVGERTIPIMCLHLLFFKIVDFIAIHFYTKDYQLLSMFTHSYDNYMYIIYGLIGIIGPYFVSSFIQIIIKKINCKSIKAW